MDLKDKNVLIIMPEFYSFQTNLKDELESRGAHVKFYDEEPKKTKFLILKNMENIFHKKDVFGKFNRQLTNQIIAEKPTEGYDYFLVIRGNVLSEETIITIKERALKNGAKTIYYTWDPVEYVRHKGKLGLLFDKRYDFDSVDVRNTDMGYELLPLFYTDEFDAADWQKPDEYLYDYVSVSAFFPYRYRYLKAFKKANPDKKLLFKLYLSPVVYWGKKIKDPKLVKNLDMDIITFKPYTHEEMRQQCKETRAILDLTQEHQQGLTMRTLETVGAKLKLVTNNAYINEYDFYNDNDYVIMSDLSAKADEAERTGDYSAFILPGEDWLSKPYQENEEIRRSYSIHAFIEKVFN
ncbi:hypothetical protein CSX00_04315 [Pseudobutyrivibrio ruminis]|uniref:Lipopolysaccharide biosynthesis protein n=2 Tax=Pseudobutyrivibrio ruminis TaxID=46206 RepID=A0A2G3EC18_9FIRM|nr:hypothetical protein CSX00_04315 [Pseudobutyrivibrio ruminis]